MCITLNLIFIVNFLFLFYINVFVLIKIFYVGWVFGENQEWFKFSNFEVIIRVFLLVFVLGVIGKFFFGIRKYFFLDKDWSDRSMVKYNQYKISDGFVEFVDIFLFFVEFAGFLILKICLQTFFNITICIEGCSFVFLIKNVILFYIVIKNWKFVVFS